MNDNNTLTAGVEHVILPVSEYRSLRASLLEQQESIGFLMALADDLTRPKADPLSDRLERLEELGRHRSDWQFIANSRLLARIAAVDDELGELTEWVWTIADQVTNVLEEDAAAPPARHVRAGWAGGTASYR